MWWLNRGLQVALVLKKRSCQEITEGNGDDLSISYGYFRHLRRHQILRLVHNLTNDKCRTKKTCRNVPNSPVNKSWCAHFFRGIGLHRSKEMSCKGRKRKHKHRAGPCRQRPKLWQLPNQPNTRCAAGAARQKLRNNKSWKKEVAKQPSKENFQITWEFACYAKSSQIAHHRCASANGCLCCRSFGRNCRSNCSDSVGRASDQASNGVRLEVASTFTIHIFLHFEVCWIGSSNLKNRFSVSSEFIGPTVV